MAFIFALTLEREGGKKKKKKEIELDLSMESHYSNPKILLTAEYLIAPEAAGQTPSLPPQA